MELFVFKQVKTTPAGNLSQTKSLPIERPKENISNSKNQKQLNLIIKFIIFWANYLWYSLHWTTEEKCEIALKAIP